MIFDHSQEIDQLTNKQKTTLGITLINDVVTKGGCDLHIHTHASDGADSSARVVQKAIENKLSCFSVTDHDSTEGVSDVIRILHKLRLIGIICPKFIPGIELSIEEEKEVHILGYFPFGGYEKTEAFLRTQRDSRNKRNIEMCELLTSQGMPISIEELQAEGGRVVGRLHTANILVRKGYVGSVKEAFKEILGDEKACYVRRDKPTAKEAIDCILDAGGIPVVAHPYLYGWTGGQRQVSKVLLAKLEKLKVDGLLGVEAFHGEASFAQQIESQAAARTLDLFCTAGSDYHGDNKKNVRMYDNLTRFYHKNDIVFVAAIIEEQDGFFAMKKTAGLNEGKWYLPSARIFSSKKCPDFLIASMQTILGLKINIKRHYNTIITDEIHQRVTLITFICKCDNNELKSFIGDSQVKGLFSLAKLCEMEMMTPDAMVIDSLREIPIEFSHNTHI